MTEVTAEIRQPLLVNRSIGSDILRIGRILGILSDPPKSYFKAKKNQALQEKSIDSAMIEKLIQERIEARKAKNWAKADQIRNKLSEMNVHLEDRPDGTVWRVVD